MHMVIAATEKRVQVSGAFRVFGRGERGACKSRSVLNANDVDMIAAGMLELRTVGMCMFILSFAGSDCVGILPTAPSPCLPRRTRSYT